MARFLSTRSENTLFETILLKNKKDKISIFSSKTVDKPLWKNAKYSTFLNPCFVVLNG